MNTGSSPPLEFVKFWVKIRYTQDQGVSQEVSDKLLLIGLRFQIKVLLFRFEDPQHRFTDLSAQPNPTG